MKPRRPGNGITIVGETLACLVFLAAGTYLAYQPLAGQMKSSGLALGWAAIITQGVALFALIFGLLGDKMKQNWRRRRAERVAPMIRERAIACAMGLAPADSLLRDYRTYPLETEACLVDSLSPLSGEQRRRLAAAAEQIGLARRWRRQLGSWFPDLRRRAGTYLGLLDSPADRATFEVMLGDHDELVRIQALRALARIARGEEMFELFEFAAGESLTVQALMSNALRSAAPMLCQEALTLVAGWKDAGRIAAALDMIRGWQRSLPMPLGPLLEHPDAQVRARALALLPYAAGFEPLAETIIRGLADPDHAVRAAAAEAAVPLKITVAVPFLAAVAREDNSEIVVRAAVFALARLGAGGARVLEAQIIHGGACAPLALEALEKLRLRRGGEHWAT